MFARVVCHWAAERLLLLRSTGACRCRCRVQALNNKQAQTAARCGRRTVCEAKVQVAQRERPLQLAGVELPAAVEVDAVEPLGAEARVAARVRIVARFVRRSGADWALAATRCAHRPLR